MKKESEYELFIFFCMITIILLFALLFHFTDQLTTNLITGAATTQTAVSEVTIEKYLSISASAGLSDGISFGTVSTLPATDINSTDNYVGTGNNITNLSITVSSDSNTNVDFCIMADALNTSAGDEIGLGNETYANHTLNNLTYPSLSQAKALTTSYVKETTNVAPGSSNYYRFWLDIPAAQPSGTYNNTIYFKGVSTGTSC